MTSGSRRESSAAVFVDRDGVLTPALVHHGLPLVSAEVDLVPLPGVDAACAALKRAGLRIVVVTNQPDIARGTLDRESVDRVNARLMVRLPLDAILVCPHDDRDGCSCRKPKPGLLVDAAGRWGLDLRASFMVGDRWRDVEAGRRAGCRTLFVDRGYSEHVPERPDAVVGDLGEAAAWILGQSMEGRR